ncbi:hypothetical protein PUNSTDRAFT_104873 [Punctularia strigosozonata HHB-11173 SS5]|uniref:uncharacterized protein n=1 Tax=Punctularia strigosozonata (strain HHB-11173) TaxID=741275 RepID=UPI0004416E57|nr:uncharacterized protein PUNSTDRAFT_104873 [Punctularia strigosozonata HHB-11173 SS5]EIN07263.1 hypothetical protein PUNSTDRAFT_104873 [Punctularia strigosozonata HHB-11173 SS5]
MTSFGTGMSTRRRSTAASTSYSQYHDSSDRTTRSSAKMRSQPKLKLKLSEKAAAQAPGMSFLGPYDRELDSDDEDLTFEEQFILRMPPGEDCERLRKMVQAREIGPDVWFKFKDSRRAVFHIGNSTYSSKLVDLPCIIESQKTLDNKQMFKVADICQMLVVEDKIANEDALTNQRNFNVDEFIWPHGITPPLHHVRKRRFRKRANKRTIESVEQEVERLLEADAMANDVQYDVLENVNPDLSDSEYIDPDGPGGMDAPTPGPMGSDVGDAPTPAADRDADQEGEEDEDGVGGDGDIDEELAAELDLALGDEGDEGDEEDDDEDDDDSDDDDEDEEDEETNQSRRLLNEEIRDLEAAVAKKNHEIAHSANPLIRKRFEDALKKLRTELDMKLGQRDDMKEQQRLRDEGIASQNQSEGVDDEDDDDDDLFGDEDGMN